MRLYSYCLRYDAGSAPNPFWGICTLTICKPVIRRTAKKDDWIVGLGSGDISDHVVYAMCVTEKMILQEYDGFCQAQFPEKLPDWRNSDYRRRVGDCIYDYTEGAPPKLRLSVHGEGNRERDLGGEYALISSHYYYFGDHRIKLPESLKPIIHNTQGHKSSANQPYVEQFISWIEGLDCEPNILHGEPQLKSQFALDPEIGRKCARRDLEDDTKDEECGPC